MKFPLLAIPKIRHLSLPVRGAWVEMVIVRFLLGRGSQSLPVRGAWVEIKLSYVFACGSKVAPRAGSVG